MKRDDIFWHLSDPLENSRLDRARNLGQNERSQIVVFDVEISAGHRGKGARVEILEYNEFYGLQHPNIFNFFSIYWSYIIFINLFFFGYFDAFEIQSREIVSPN